MATLKGPQPQQPDISRSSIARPGRPGMRKNAWRKYGPRLYRLSEDPEQVGGPGKPPEAFLSGKTSASEWPLWWAMAKIWGVPTDPRRGPFEGDFGGIWGYQRYFPIQGATGKTNVDFVYYGKGHFIGIRVQSEHFHLATDAAQQALDEWLGGHNYGVSQIVDVYEQDYLSDLTGASACKVMADACRGIQNAGPLRKGNTYRIKRPVFE